MDAFNFREGNASLENHLQPFLHREINDIYEINEINTELDIIFIVMKNLIDFEKTSRSINAAVTIYPRTRTLNSIK